MKRLGYITAKPDVFSFDLTNDKFDFVILASDGLWDVVSDQEAVEMTHSLLSKEPTNKLRTLIAARSLIEFALQRNTVDNVSAFVILLPPHL